MAYADYHHCAVCDCKAFYRANIHWDEQRAKLVGSICNDCYKEGYRLEVTPPLDKVNAPIKLNEDAEIWENTTPFK